MNEKRYRSNSKKSRKHRRNQRLCTFAGLLATSLACSSTRPTEIVAGVSTQIRVPDDIRAVGVVVQANGAVEFCEHYSVVDGVATLPATLGVLGQSGLSTRGTVTVQVIGFRTARSEFEKDCLVRAEDTGLDAMVIRRRRLTFVDDQIKFLPLPLKESCADNHCSSEAETCIGGKCVIADIDAASLSNYSDSLLFGNTNTCFDARRCLAEGLTVPVQLEDPKTCTFKALWPARLQKPAPGDLNVRLFFKSFGSEVLDLDFDSTAEDQREGFAFAGEEDDALTFKLAPNLCENAYAVDNPSVLSIDASAACTAKRALQPICDSYVPPNLHAGSGGSGTGGAGSGGSGTGGNQGSGICTLAGLEPVESVVYVLMDQSKSMSKFFGDGGLAFAVSLPLSSPVARRTKVAFDFLPPQEEQCGTDAYATPRVPFGAVEDVRVPIGVLLSNEKSVLPTDPPQFFLEAALQGAYQGVASVEANDPKTGFNRRAVVVISNRDISAGSCPGPNAVELAERAHAAADGRIFTYAIALDSGEPDALSSAASLADAGGTRVFNGVTDEAEGARAVNDILTELGTCLYKVNRADAAKGEDLPTSASISYIDPSRPTRAIAIPHDAACNENAASTVSGWNQETESGLVRLCGEACADLRQAIGDVSVFHAAQGKIPPSVPLVATAACSEFQRH